MSNLAKVAFMLSVVAPMVASAQTAQQPKPAPQAPAAPSSASPTPAAKPSPSQRFAPSENFYRPSVKPQPGVSTPSAVTSSPAKPSTQPVTIVKPTAMPAPLPVRPPVSQPAAVAPVPEIRHLPGVMATPAPAPASATAAAVDYASGQLTVIAENAPLGVVLNMIAAKTGAVIDLAPELRNEPVVARLGPGSVREVLTGLLDSPRIDYIVLGGSDEGERLERVVVRLRHSMGLSAMAPPRAQPKPENPDEEGTLGPNGLVPQGTTEAEPQLSQQQRMANWQKARERMRVAEIKQQAQERENEANGSPDPPAPPQENRPPNPPQTPQSDPPRS